MHVGYGPVLEKFGPEIKATLAANEEELYGIMHEHFLRHLQPLGA